MEIKYTPGGLLIYIAMAGYLAAFAVRLFGGKRLSGGLFLGGFLSALAAFGYRWHHVNHIPLQNLFEVFVSLGAGIYPLSLLSARLLRQRDLVTESADMLIGAIVLFPAGFIFSAEPQNLPPALQSSLFSPHVAVYMLSYILMTKAAVQGTLEILKFAPAGVDTGCCCEYAEKSDYEQAAYKLICAGFPLLTAGLVLGSIWGRIAWGDYWGWDPKELWSLASWLVYVGYFHFRFMFGRRYRRINGFMAVIGLVVIIITLLWVNLSKVFPGLHSYAT